MGRQQTNTNMQTAPGQHISIRQLLCQLEQFDQDESIEAAIQKPEFQSLLCNIFHALSPQTKAAARKWIEPSDTSSGTTRGKSSVALAIIRKTTSTELPPEIESWFEDCKADVSLFWKACIIPTLSIGDSTVSIRAAVSSLYLGLQSLQLRRRQDHIVWRYYTLFLYDLALFIGNGQQKITEKLLGGLLHILNTSESIPDTIDHIKDNVLRWCGIGHRWEDENLLRDACLGKAASILSSAGICATSRSTGADQLGSKIRSHALEPFRWNLSVLQAVPREGIEEGGRVE